MKWEPGRWKLSCRPSGVTTAWRYWEASSSLPAAARQGTMVETLPVTCCTDTTPATTSGPGYCSKEPVPFFLWSTFNLQMKFTVYTAQYTEYEDFDHLHSSTTKFNKGGHMSRCHSKRKLLTLKWPLFILSFLSLLVAS